MTKKTSDKKILRLKVLGGAVGGLVGGVVLIYLHTVVLGVAEKAEPVAPPAAQDQQADPAGEAPASDLPSPKEQRRAIASNMGSLLFMLGLMSLGVTVICVGWIVWDIYHSQPAWKKQTKYPRRR